MKGTNVRLEYSPERLAWHRWHLHQHMAVTSSSMAVSLGRSWTSPWMCAMVWWMCWDLGLGRCNWGWLMSKLASDFHRVGKRSVLRTFRKAHLVIQKKLGRKDKISFCTFWQVLYFLHGWGGNQLLSSRWSSTCLGLWRWQRPTFGHLFWWDWVWSQTKPSKEQL